MGVNASRATHIPDSAENVAELRAHDAGSITATTTEPGVLIEQFTATLPAQGREPFALMIAASVFAISMTGDNAYSLEVWSDTVADGSDDPLTLLRVPIKAVSQVRLEVESINIPEDHEWIGVRAVLSGSSTPLIDYGCNIVGSRHHASH